jgi:prepilin-type N-terminal cleavage/methylation domain-containing protein/prepilin-type processing-associated H-X9-DG protein
MKNYKKNLGFTLVEMLIVIAIIGILMSMLVPSISRAKKHAKRIECASNLHQMYVASVTYATDYDRGHFPPAISSERWRPMANDGAGEWQRYSRGWVDWYKYENHDSDYGNNPPQDLKTYWWGDKGETCITNGAIYPYVRDIRVYICPSFKRYVKDNGDSTYKESNRSYVMNMKVSWGSFFRLQADKKGMSRRMLFADGAYEKKYGAKWGLKDDGDHSDDTKDWRYYFRGSDGALEWENEQLGDYHKDKANVVFLDGHAEWLDPAIKDLTKDICTGEYEPDQK